MSNQVVSISKTSFWVRSFIPIVTILSILTKIVGMILIMFEWWPSSISECTIQYCCTYEVSSLSSNLHSRCKLKTCSAKSSTLWPYICPELISITAASVKFVRPCNCSYWFKYYKYKTEFTLIFNTASY